MPLYEFQCKNCEEIFEKLMKVTDPDPESCWQCSKGPVVKLMSRTHFVLKGQGWYETDFKSKNAKSSDPGKGKEKGPLSEHGAVVATNKPGSDAVDSGSGKASGSKASMPVSGSGKGSPAVDPL